MQAGFGGMNESSPHVGSDCNASGAKGRFRDRRIVGTYRETMKMDAPHPISIDDAFGALTFLSGRTPSTTAEQSAGAFLELTPYREGGVFVGYWAGNSEWERHSVGEEIVFVIEGETTFSS